MQAYILTYVQNIYFQLYAHNLYALSREEKNIFQTFGTNWLP